MSMPNLKLKPETEAAMRCPFILNTNVLTALTMLGALQLALRHPRFKGTPSGQEMTNVARDIQRVLEQAIPECKFLMEAGWNERFDR